MLEVYGGSESSREGNISGDGEGVLLKLFAGKQKPLEIERLLS
jgi:hypothetical protein